MIGFVLIWVILCFVYVDIKILCFWLLVESVKNGFVVGGRCSVFVMDKIYFLIM